MLLLRSWNIPSEWMFGQEIGHIGHALADGRGFTIGDIPTAKFPPVYPYIVGGVFTIWGEFSKYAAVALFLFQSICAAGTAVCLAILSTRFINQKACVIAGFAWAFYPGSLFYSVKFVWYSELSVMLILLIATILTSEKTNTNYPRIAFLGGLTGLLILTDSAMLVYPLLLFLWMLIDQKVRLVRWISLIIIWGLAAGVVVAPWAIRNFIIFGSPEILKSNLGLELFFGNNPYSSGGILDQEREQALDSLNEKEKIDYEGQSQNVFYHHLQDQAIEWIRTHPVNFIQLTVLRFSQFWGKFPDNSPDTWSKPSRFLLLWYIPLLGLALAGFFLGIRHGLHLTPIWLFLIVYPLPYYVTHVQQYRYRYPVEPFLMFLAVIPISIWLDRFYFGVIKPRLAITQGE